MKTFLKVKNISIAVTIALVAFSCNLDDGVDNIPVPDTTLVELISDDPDFSTLVTALERADLVSTLQGNGPFTVFAPDNNAFANFLGTAGFASVNDVPESTLRQLLLNHVVLGSVESATLINLQRNYLKTMADGPSDGTQLSLYFDASDAVTFNGASNVTEADNPASNGIYHTVDAVITLPTLRTFISEDQNFQSFDTALDLISLVSDLPTSLEQGNGPWTIFVPVEEAFENLLDSDPDWNFVSDIEENLLNDVISHHILNGNIRSTSLSGGQMETTLEGSDITFVSLDGELEITDGSGNEGAQLEVLDIQASNGVIHVISVNVLLPDTTN